MCQEINPDTICSGCLNDLNRVFCPRSAQIHTPNPLWQHEWHSAWYEPPLPNIVHEWKHGGKMALARVAQTVLFNSLPNWLPETQIDAILPMPISDKRRIHRGFNQCDDLADCVGKHLNCPILPHRAVFRQHKMPQSSLNKHERLQNIRGVFTVNEKYLNDFVGKNILLLDDIYTTGATLGELAQTVLNAGAKSVSVWVLARNRQSLD